MGSWSAYVAPRTAPLLPPTPTPPTAPHGTVICRGTRPGPAWYRHGETSRWVWVFASGRLMKVQLRKQRWFDTTTGRTCHSRPPWEEAWTAFGLGGVMLVLHAWLFATRGLHHVDWPWRSARPSRRTAQRWRARLRTDGLAWLLAIRRAAIDLLSPRPLDEIVPVGGIPPPRQGARPQNPVPQQDGHLAQGIWILTKVEQQQSIEIRTVLAEAKARWPGSTPTSPTVPSP